MTPTQATRPVHDVLSRELAQGALRSYVRQRRRDFSGLMLAL